jgi:hypothetical protein
MGLNSFMNCCFYNFAFVSLLTFLVTCAATPEAWGQESNPRRLQADNSESQFASPRVDQGEPAQLRNTIAPMLGSPQAIVIPASEPAMRKLQASEAAPRQAPQPTERPARKGLSPQTIGSGDSNAKSEDYWKPTPGNTETLEYEKLDAETVRDLFNADSVRKLRKPMKDIRIVAEDNADVPKNLAAQFMVKEPVLKIVAAGISPPRPDRYPIQFKHRPLYYQQPHLERCGRGCGFAQNAISAGQFCVNTFFLPYHMCKTKPSCPVTCGGDCLSCQPYSVDCNVLPLSYKGLATEAAAYAGFTFLLL